MGNDYGFSVLTGVWNLIKGNLESDIELIRIGRRDGIIAAMEIITLLSIPKVLDAGLGKL